MPGSSHRKLTIEKQKLSQARVSSSGDYISIDPKEKDSVRIAYQYLNKKYRTTVKVVP